MSVLTAKGRALLCEDIATRYGDRIDAEDQERVLGDAFGHRTPDSNAFARAS